MKQPGGRTQVNDLKCICGGNAVFFAIVKVDGLSVKFGDAKHSAPFPSAVVLFKGGERG